MGLIVVALAAILLLWALALITVSAFFRGMAIAAVGASLLNIAAHEGFPPALSTIGALLLVLPMVTTFKRLIFGES
jgi:hypothetical protein